MSTKAERLFLFGLLCMAVHLVFCKQCRIPIRQLRGILCRRCWHKMYRVCNSHVGLTKRSASFSLTEDVDMTAGTPHHLVRRQIRSRRRRASRKCRVKIKVNCNVCRTKCFNRYG